MFRIFRPSRGSKRKRTVSNDSNTDQLSSVAAAGVASTSGISASASSSTGPSTSKRSRRTAASNLNQEAVEDESSSELHNQEVADNQSNNGDQGRRLNDLVDFFPYFHLGRRLTRSLAR